VAVFIEVGWLPQKPALRRYNIADYSIPSPTTYPHWMALIPLFAMRQ